MVLYAEESLSAGVRYEARRRTSGAEKRQHIASQNNRRQMVEPDGSSVAD